MSDDQPGESFLEWFFPLWRRRRRPSIIVFLLVAAAGVTIALSLPDIYQSAVTVLVERQQAPESLIKATVTGELEARLQAITQEILSRERLESLIVRFDLYRESRGRATTADLAERLRRDIGLELKSVERRDRTDATVAFNVLFRGREPRTVATVTNALATLYVEENVRRRQHQAASAAALLSGELLDTKKRLDEQERVVGEFKNQHFGSLPEQYQMNVLRLERLRTELRLNRDMQMKVRDRRDLLDQVGRLDAAPGGTVPETASARLLRLRRELAELRRSYSDKYPDVIRLQNEVDEVRREVAQGGASEDVARTPAADTARRTLPLRQADAELASLNTEEQNLRQEIGVFERRVGEGPRLEQELAQLTRDQEAMREYYRSLLSRLGDARLGETTEERRSGEQFRILDPAVPAAQPVAPRRVRIVLIGLALALTAAAGTILVAEHVDRSFHSVRDIRAVSHLPVAAAIPRIVTDAERRHGRWRLGAVWASAMVAVGVVVAVSFVVAHDNERLVLGRTPVATVESR